MNSASSNVWGLERSQISTHLFPDFPWTYPWSWKESTFVSVALYCLVYCQLGSWNDFPWCTFHRWLVSRWSEGSWKESQILRLSPLLAVLVVRDLKWLSFPRYTYVRGSWNGVLKGTRFAFSLPVLIRGSWNGVLKGVKFASFPSTWTAVVLRSAAGHLRGTLPSIFVILVRFVGFASLAVTGCAIFWHITFMRPSLTLAGCPMMISLRAGVSTMKNWWSWKESLL